VGRGRIVFRHAFRNSLIPVVTFIGADIGSLLGGAIGYAFDGTARPLALALLASGLACLVLVLWSEKGKLFGPSDAEAGMGRRP
jgi:DHA1 family bicyclomycin/chloramphenicol resistance-like MFS transporter